MIVKKYAFVGPCYIGELFIDTTGQKHKFIWADDSNFTELAKNFKKYLGDCLSSTERINIFIDERTIDERRPDRSMWLNQCEIPLTATKIEIFLSIHGVSINDLFWIDDNLDNSYWYKTLQYC